MFYAQRSDEIRHVYFIGERPNKHDLERTVVGRTVDRSGVLFDAGSILAIALAFYTLSPLACWFGYSHVGNDGDVPDGWYGILVILAVVFGTMGMLIAIAGTVICFIEGMFQDCVRELMTLRGRNLSGERERCVPIRYSRSEHYLYSGPASVTALLGALKTRKTQGQAMDALCEHSALGLRLKPLVDEYLIATAKADVLLTNDVLKGDKRNELQREMNALAGQCADRIGVVLRSEADEAERVRKQVEDQAEVEALRETVELAEKVKINAMLALSDMQVTLDSISR